MGMTKYTRKPQKVDVKRLMKLFAKFDNFVGYLKTLDMPKETLVKIHAELMSIGIWTDMEDIIVDIEEVDI